MGYRSERAKEKATAEAFQQALDKVGIKVNLKPLPDDDYSSETCGKPAYVVKNNIGLNTNGWGADWNDRLRLPVADRGQPADQPRGWFVELRGPDPRGRQDARPVARGAGQRQARGDSWEIDKRVMERVIYPGVYAKACCSGKNVTNVFVNEAFGSTTTPPWA